MNIQNMKCVMIIDESLPCGLIANTAAIMGLTLGKHIPEVVGKDVIDNIAFGSNSLRTLAVVCRLRFADSFAIGALIPNLGYRSASIRALAVAWAL